MRASAKGHSGVVLESQLGASGPLCIVVSPVAVTLATSATMMSQACQLRTGGLATSGKYLMQLHQVPQSHEDTRRIKSLTHRKVSARSAAHVPRIFDAGTKHRGSTGDRLTSSPRIPSGAHRAAPRLYLVGQWGHPRRACALIQSGRTLAVPWTVAWRIRLGPAAGRTDPR